MLHARLLLVVKLLDMPNWTADTHSQFNRVLVQIVRGANDIPAGWPELFEEGPTRTEWGTMCASACEVSADVLRSWLKPAESIALRSKSRTFNDARKGFLQWVKDVSSSSSIAGAIYAYVRPKSATLQSSARDPWDNGKVLVTPMALADIKAKEWTKWWCRFPEDLLTTFLRVNDVKEIAQAEPMSELDLDNFDDALFTFKDKTGSGTDAISPRFVKNLPAAARSECLSILKECEACLSWPWQLNLEKAVTVPKPAGGDRCVFLITFLQRLWLRT